MNEEKRINYLAILLSCSFIIICIFGYYVTEENNNWYWKLVNNLIPELLGSLLPILFVYYVFTKKGISIFEPFKNNKNDLKFAYSLSELPKKHFGVTISTHLDNSSINQNIRLKGNFEFLPENIKIRVYIANHNQTLCWIGIENILIDKDLKSWETTAYIGGNDGSGEVYYIIVALEDEVTDQWVKYYSEISQQLDNYKPFNYPLPKTILETNKIKVTRI